MQRETSWRKPLLLVLLCFGRRLCISTRHRLSPPLPLTRACVYAYLLACFWLVPCWACQAALIDHLERKGGDDDTDDGDVDNEEGESRETPSYALVQGTLQKHLRLDSAAAAAVTLLPDPTAPHQYGSLYDVLNR